MKFLATVLLLLGAVAGYTKVNFGKYPFHKVLDGRYTLWWKRIQATDKDPAQLQLVLDVQANGWVGFGIAEQASGGMQGSDIVMVSVDEKGKTSIKDLHALSYGVPIEDECDNWRLLNGYQTVDGHTIVEIARDVNVTKKGLTGEIGDVTEDRVFESFGDTRVIWAFHDSSDDMQMYHGTINRGTSVINFWNATSDKNPIDAVIADTVNNKAYPIKANYSVTNAPRQVVETVVDWYDTQPRDVAASYIVAINPNINSAFVHHLTLYTCPSSTYNKTEAIPCRTSRKFLWTGDATAGAMVLPAGVAFKIGADPESQIFILQTHIHNDMGFTGAVETSGVTLYYTTNTPTYIAGSLALGDPDTGNYVPIAANEVLEVEYSCPSQCTSQFGQNMNVIFERHVVRDIGTGLLTTLNRKDAKGKESLKILSQVKYASYDRVHVNQAAYTIAPGDRLNTHCYYSNTKSGYVGGGIIQRNFGPTAPSEACIHYMIYYPRLPTSKQPLEKCGLMLDGTFMKYGCTAFSSPDMVADGDLPKNLQFGDMPPLNACNEVLGKKFLKFFKEHPSESIGGLIFLFIVLGVIIASVIAVIYRRQQLKKQAKKDFQQVVGTDFAKDNVALDDK